MSEIQMWRYDLPPVNGEGWGIFLLDSTGMFAAVTDYGNYAYCWTHHGETDFRKFVIDLEKSPGYLLGKVARHAYSYDGEKSLDLIKENILELRKDGSLTKEDARKEWDLLDDYEFESECNFGQWLDKTSLGDAWEYYRESYSVSACAFAKELIPRLATVLREGLLNNQ